jgi:tetratricopeptide (TPR) repeat protein
MRDLLGPSGLDCANHLDSACKRGRETSKGLGEHEWVQISDVERRERSKSRIREKRQSMGRDESNRCLKLGLTHLESGDYEQAVEQLSMAIELNPRDAAVYHNRGLALGELRDYDRAIEDFTQVIALEPQSAQAYCNRGAAYGNSGRHQRAIEEFDRAIELNPRDAGLHVMRGFAHSALGQHDLAVGDIERGIEVCESDVERQQLRELLQRVARLRARPAGSSG